MERNYSETEKNIEERRNGAIQRSQMPKLEKSVQKRIRLSGEGEKMLEELAEENNMSENKVFETALKLYYTQEIMDEHIVLARINALERQLRHTDKKLETFSNLMYFLVPYFLATQPDLPKNKDEATLVLNKGTNKMVNLVSQFRKYCRTEKIGFMQSVWGDFQEEAADNDEAERGKEES